MDATTAFPGNGRMRDPEDPRYFRPTEVDLLIGDSSKAQRKLGWEAKVTFKELVRTMVDADIECVRPETDGSNVSSPPGARPNLVRTLDENC